MESRRTSFEKTITFNKPERLILDLGGCPLSGMDESTAKNLADYLGLSGYKSKTGYGIDDRILEYLDIDTRGVGDILTPSDSQYKKISDSEYIDEWGVRRKKYNTYWEICENPLANASIDDLSHYDWPSPYKISDKELKKIADDAKYYFEQTDYIVCASHPVYGVFELACWLCGFDNFLMKMALEPDFVEKLFNILLEYQIIVIEKYYSAVGSYIHYTSSGDDFATQSSTFMSPPMFSEMVAPYYAKRINHTKKFTKAKYLHHSCGNVSGIIDRIIDTGVEILNPIQPTGGDMAPESLHKKFYGKVVFHGGLDTQTLLPNGTKESIYNGVRSLLKNIGAEKGGYIFAAAHNLQPDVPPENIITMFKAAREIYGEL